MPSRRSSSAWPTSRRSRQSLKRRIKSAMVYPIVVITVACVIVGFILYFIIPKFEAIFNDFGVAAARR